MIRGEKLLTDLQTQKLAKVTGRHKDGGGLILVVDAKRANWSFRFTLAGRDREMGLGAYPAVPLAMARARRDEARLMIQSGTDPIAERKAATTTARAIPTFAEAVKEFVEAKGDGWCAVNRHQWSKLTSDCSQIASKPVDEIDTADVLKVLKPVWTRTPESAVRLRGRIERVMSFSQSHGHIHADRSNPARWKGHLENLLVGRRATDRGHHAALPYAEIPAFVDDLRKIETVSARALEFCLLTATRTTETLAARWSEISREARTWTIPGERMKGGRAHVVPLSDRALAILDELEAARESDYVFPGRGSNITSLKMTMRKVRPAATVHGLRSSFRDWCGDEVDVPREIAEAALAHVVGGVEGAYRRGTALERRARLMAQWAAYCGGVEPADGATVTDLDAFRRRA
jgi:integrase